MRTLKPAPDGQKSLGGFGAGNVVKLDGGQRLRLDDKVDFWPATQAWQTLDATASTSGVGMNSMLAFLKESRTAEGRPVAGPASIASDRRVTCNHCGRLAELHDALAVYPHRKDLEDRRFWVCWPCEAWVGCHSGSHNPFGPLANSELRTARHGAHTAFDPIWQEHRMERSDAYAWLAQSLGIPRHRCHIGMMTLEECLRVKQIVWDRFGAIASW